MKQDIINKAQNILAEKRRKALAEYDAKMQPLYANEEFVQLEKELTRLQIEKARKSAYGENSSSVILSHDQRECVEGSTDLLKSVNEENKLISQLNSIKKQHNLQNVTPNFSCPLCKDEGYKNGQMCNCLKKEISQILMRESSFEKMEKFEDAQKTCGDLAPVYALMKKWCNSDFKKNLIYIAGPTGVGKTYLIRCMANELIERGKVVKIVTAYQLNQDFKEFSRTYNEDILDSYTSGEVLFIDDLGTEPIYRNVTQEFLYLVINERKMKRLPTIITSNLNMEDVRDRYDERIFSRIADRETSITLFIDGEDKRIKK